MRTDGRSSRTGWQGPLDPYLAMTGVRCLADRRADRGIARQLVVSIAWGSRRGRPIRSTLPLAKPTVGDGEASESVLIGAAAAAAAGPATRRSMTGAGSPPRPGGGRS